MATSPLSEMAPFDLDNRLMSVLLVDDDDSLVDMSSVFLERELNKVETTTLTDPEAVLDEVESGNYDCIVSDFDMPGLDGLELLSTLREEGVDIPFVLFTGKGSEEIASRAITAGVDEYLQKGGPEEYPVLANKVENLVEKHWAETQVQRGFLAIESAEEGIGIIDEDGVYQYMNEAYAAVYNRDRSELVGEHWDMLYPPDEAERFHDEILPELETTGAWSGVSTGVTKDGDPVPERLVLTQMDNGGHVCIVRDTSDQQARKQAISNLHQTARRLMEAETVEEIGEITTTAARDILRLPANGMHLYNEQRNALVPVSWTDATEDLVGTPPAFEPNESIAWTAFETGDTQTHDDISTVEQRYNPDTPVRSQLALPIDEWGTLLIGSPEPNAFDDIDVELAETLVAHVTTALDRVERENSIKTSEARYRSLTDDVLDTSDIGTFILDSEFDVVWVSEATTEYFGLNREKVVGADKRQLIETNIKEIVDDSEGFAETVVATYDDNTYVEEFECHILGSEDREERWLKHWSQPIESGLYAGGRIEHYTDITRRKHREQQLQEQNDRLDEFASIVSHDLRNPLNVAEGNLELAREDCNSEHLATVARAHDRMQVLIDDLLTLAREGEEIGDTEAVAFNTLVEDCWTNLATKDATIDIDLDRTVRADRSRLQQLLENLLRNAVDHGGEDVTVTIGALDDGFYVEDDGPGIPPGHREQVFETGYSTATEGTGFGLSIVQQVVDAHDWQIYVTEGFDGGARFEITGVEFADC